MTLTPPLVPFHTCQVAPPMLAVALLVPTGAIPPFCLSQIISSIALLSPFFFGVESAQMS